MKKIGVSIIGLLVLAFGVLAQTPEELEIKAIELYNEGNAFMRAGNFSEAITKYQEALKIKEDHMFYYQLGLAQLRLNRFDDAIASLENAVKHGAETDATNIGLAGAYMGKGEQQFNAGNFSGAASHYSKAIEYNPDPRYYYRLGVALRRDNQDRQAIEAYKKAAEIEPTYALAYAGLGAAYVSLEQYDDAIESYTKALEFEPNLRAALHGLGVAYTAKGNILLNQTQIRNAIELFTKATEVFPEHAQAYLLLAVAYNRIDQATLAEQNARKALELRQRGTRGSEWFELGIALKKQGKIENAKQAFREAAKDPRYRRNAEYELEELARR